MLSTSGLRLTGHGTLSGESIRNHPPFCAHHAKARACERRQGVTSDTEDVSSERKPSRWRSNYGDGADRCMRHCNLPGPRIQGETLPLPLGCPAAPKAGRQANVSRSGSVSLFTCAVGVEPLPVPHLNTRLLLCAYDGYGGWSMPGAEVKPMPGPCILANALSAPALPPRPPPISSCQNRVANIHSCRRWPA